MNVKFVCTRKMNNTSKSDTTVPFLSALSDKIHNIKNTKFRRYGDFVFVVEPKFVLMSSTT